MENLQDNFFRILMKATVTNGDWNSYLVMLRYFVSESRRGILYLNSLSYLNSKF